MALLAAAMAQVCVASAGEPPRYVYTDLGFFHELDPTANATDISENGFITGFAFDLFATNGEFYFFVTHTFLTTAGGELQDLGNLQAIDNASGSHGWGVNDAGVVVGDAVFADIPNPKNFANVLAPPVMWVEGRVISLGLLECGHGGIAEAINNRNQVVGYNSIVPPGEDETFRAFLWEDGVLSTVPGLPDVWSEAYDINENGHIVGRAFLTPGMGHPFLARDGKIVDLTSDPKNLPAWARALNNLGQVVGRGYPGGLLWDDGEVALLPRLDGFGVDPFDINDFGMIVGLSFAPGLPAVLWHEGEVYDLNDLIQRPPGLENIQLLRADAINNRGRIVGKSRTKNVSGIEHAFLLEPVTPDLTGDDVVDSADLTQLLVRWGSHDPYADLSGDGVVNGADLARLLANWGPVPPPQPYDWIP